MARRSSSSLPISSLIARPSSTVVGGAALEEIGHVHLVPGGAQPVGRRVHRGPQTRDEWKQQMFMRPWCQQPLTTLRSNAWRTYCAR